MTTALEIFENGFDDYENREYALEGPQTGSVEGQLYFFWPEDVVKIRKALTPPPVDGDLAEAVKMALALCKCRGTGKIDTDCTLCGDSTFDHECNDKEIDCERCKPVRERIQAATSQQAREWTETEIYNVVRASYRVQQEEVFLAGIESETIRRTLRALAAKNIIRLKDGG